MPDMNAIQAQMQQQYDKIYKPQIDSLTNQFNSTLAQKQQTRSQIPSQYDSQRAGAALTMQQASAALPTNVLNRGYSIGPNGNSGLAYSMGRDIANGYQKNMGTIGTAQNNAIQSADNDIANLKTNYDTNLNSLNTKEAQDIASASQNEYNYQRQVEAAIEKAKYDAQVAAAQAYAKASQKSGTSSSDLSKIANSAMKATGSKTYDPLTGTYKVNYLKSVQNIQDALNQWGITDTNEQSKVFALSGINLADYNNQYQKSVANVYNTLSQIGAQKGATSGGKYTATTLNNMKEALVNRMNDGSIQPEDALKVAAHYGIKSLNK